LQYFTRKCFPIFFFGGAAPESLTRGGLQKLSLTPPPHGNPLQHIFGDKPPHTLPIMEWGPRMAERNLQIRKISRLHNKKYPTWKLITTTPLLLYLLNYNPPWTWKISHLHLHTLRPTEIE
jgi:hypothetical protein